MVSLIAIPHGVFTLEFLLAFLRPVLSLLLIRFLLRQLALVLRIQFYLAHGVIPLKD